VQAKAAASRKARSERDMAAECPNVPLNIRKTGFGYILEGFPTFL